MKFYNSRHSKRNERLTIRLSPFELNKIEALREYLSYKEDRVMTLSEVARNILLETYNNHEKSIKKEILKL